MQALVTTKHSSYQENNDDRTLRKDNAGIHTKVNLHAKNIRLTQADSQRQQHINLLAGQKGVARYIQNPKKEKQKQNYNLGYFTQKIIS